jgi:hypothetical protein
MADRSAADIVSRALDRASGDQAVSLDSIFAAVRPAVLPVDLSDEELRELIALQALARGRAVSFGKDAQQ